MVSDGFVGDKLKTHTFTVDIDNSINTDVIDGSYLLVKYPKNDCFTTLNDNDYNCDNSGADCFIFPRLLYVLSI